MKKQSSIEWLVEQFEKIVFYSEEAKEEIIDQAKQMHKQEIRDAFRKGTIYSITNLTSKQYYKNTYEKEN